jgi:hypothetical protein
MERYPAKSNWKPIATAPTNVELELCTFDNQEFSVLLFPYRRNGVGWSDVTANRMVAIRPTHWRHWERKRA